MAMTLRTDDELDRALTELSDQEGVSRQEIVRRAVLERLQRTEHVRAVAGATERGIARWGDVLHRLGTV